MVSLVETIAKSLVSKPEEVVVTVTGSDEKSMTLQLKVAQDDMGKIIGHSGRIAKALRTVVKAASQREGKIVTIEIVS